MKVSSKRALDMNAVRTFNLKPKPPFNFDLTLTVTPPPAPFNYVDGVLSRAFRLSSKRTIPVKVKSVGTVSRPVLTVSVPSRISAAEKSEITGKLSWFLCLDDDLAGMYRLMERDPVLRRLKDKLYGVKPWTAPSIFEGILDCIIFQQVSLWAAFAMIRAFVERMGERVEFTNETFYDYPNSETVARSSVEELKKCKLSRNKASYVKGVAEKVVTGGFNPEELGRLPTAEAYDRLRSFKGIGVWTAEAILSTSLKRWEVFPADDLGVRRALSRLYLNRDSVTGEEVRKVGERWKNYKWPIAYYLLVASERAERILRS